MERHFGIDLIKAVSMLMVCVLHANLFGVKVGGAGVVGTGPWITTWVTEQLCIIAVNLYALTTGYLCICSRWKMSRYIQLYALVMFYTVMGYAAAAILQNSGFFSTGIPESGFDWFTYFPLPGGKSYWYFIAYTALFFIVPALNSALNSMSRSRMAALVFFLAVLLPLLNLFYSDLYLGGGYNLPWLLALYVVGAYIRLYPPQIKNWVLITLWFAIVVWGTYEGQDDCKSVFFCKMFYNYTSPLLSISSICAFILASRLKCQSKRVSRLMYWGSTLSFGVYIIHLHPYVWSLIGKGVPYCYIRAGYPSWYLPVAGLLIYLGSLMIDRMRHGLFKLMKINDIAESVSHAAEKRLRKILAKTKE